MIRFMIDISHNVKILTLTYLPMLWNFECDFFRLFVFFLDRFGLNYSYFCSFFVTFWCQVSLFTPNAVCFMLVWYGHVKL